MTKISAVYDHSEWLLNAVFFLKFISFLGITSLSCKSAQFYVDCAVSSKYRNVVHLATEICEEVKLKCIIS
jgi:hypothetical protein